MLRRVLGVLLAALVFSVAGSARAQTAREPIDVPSTGWTAVQGSGVPFAPGDPRGAAGMNLDDASWDGAPVPGLWHTGFDELPERGWYRLHVRVRGAPGADPAVLIPPIHGAWVAYLNGRRIGESGRIGDRSAPGRVRGHVLALPWLSPGPNVVAIEVERIGRWAGPAGELRVGSAADLERRMRRGELLAAGFCMLFLGMFVFSLALFGAESRERAPLWFALTAGAAALYVFAHNDLYYLIADDTQLRGRIVALSFFAAHGAAMAFGARLFRAPVRWAAGGIVVAAFVGMGASAAAPSEVVERAQEVAWVLTFAGLGWTLWQAGRLPARSTVVRAGARAGIVGLMVALGFDVWNGTLELIAPGAFEYAFVPFAATLLGALAVEQTVLRGRAARILAADRDGVVVVDRFGLVQHANPAMGELLGRRPDELAGRVITALLPVGERLALSDTIRRLSLEGARPLASYELRLEGPDGPLPAELQATALEEARVMLSFRDLTDRRRLEAEVARAQRLDSLGMLAGGIAHDFNNLLAGILVSSTELERESEQSVGVADPRLTSIAEEARRGGALTERLLQFARGRTSTPDGVELATAVPEMLDLLARTLGRNLEWTIVVPPNGARVAIDEGELEQIVLNLCVNARDAMAPKGGRLRVSVEEEGDEATVAVEDSGRGIPPELLDRIYEPFFTTKGSGSGTGLGLAVVHGIVRRRGGRIHIDSEVGRGTRVAVTLPRMTAPVAEVEPTAAPTTPRVAEDFGLRVLLVDDEETLRTFLAKALRARSMEVTVLGGGREVGDWLAEQPAESPVDIVVMDMMMPGVDGAEATRALRERWAGLPVVISSGFTGRDDITELEAGGPTEVLRKPYRPDDLASLLRRMAREAAAPLNPRRGPSVAS